MLNLLDRYGGNKFLKKVLIDWHEAVVAERDIRHYYINVNLPLLDVPLSHFIMRPSIAVPRPSVSQTASD